MKSLLDPPDPKKEVSYLTYIFNKTQMLTMSPLQVVQMGTMFCVEACQILISVIRSVMKHGRQCQEGTCQELSAICRRCSLELYEVSWAG